MVDAVDSKSTTSDSVRVQVPWLVPIEYKELLVFINSIFQICIVLTVMYRQYQHPSAVRYIEAVYGKL